MSLNKNRVAVDEVAEVVKGLAVCQANLILKVGR